MRTLIRGVLFLFILLIFSQIVFSIGIRPSIYSIDFVPNHIEDFKFIVTDTDSNTNIRLYVDGDLTEYVSLSTDLIRHEDDHAFTATVSLPAVIETPGKNRIFIVAELAPISGSSSGVSAIGIVRAPIDVIVPYPGRYLKYNLNVKDANEDEPVDIKLDVTNLGTETVNLVSATLNIYDSQENKKDTLNTESVVLPSKQGHTFTKQLDTQGYRPGSYKVIAIVNHDDGEEILEKGFRIGTLKVDITNYTKVFVVNTINKFELKVDSKWNSKITEAFAVVNVSKEGDLVHSFKTFTTPLDPWETKILDGFFDTSGLGHEEYDADITLYYEGQKTEGRGKFNIKKLTRFSLNTVLTTLLILLIIIIIVAVDVWWIIHKHKKQRSEEKKEDEEI